MCALSISLDAQHTFLAGGAQKVDDRRKPYCAVEAGNGAAPNVWLRTTSPDRRRRPHAAAPRVSLPVRIGEVAASLVLLAVALGSDPEGSGDSGLAWP